MLSLANNFQEKAFNPRHQNCESFIWNFPELRTSPMCVKRPQFFNGLFIFLFFNDAIQGMSVSGKNIEKTILLKTLGIGRYFVESKK